MALIKIGKYVLNPGQVFVADKQDIIKVFLSGVTNGDGASYYCEFRGEEAEALRHYFNSIAVDVLGQYRQHQIESLPETQEPCDDNEIDLSVLFPK